MSWLRGRRTTGYAAIALAVYAALLVIAPVAHADVADHVKASSHCQVCTANPLAARVEPRIASATPTLASAGEVAAYRAAFFVAPVASGTSGRSPPA
jgi:hypothetical protein